MQGGWSPTTSVCFKKIVKRQELNLGDLQVLHNQCNLDSEL
jgi:hypothetical protein